MWDFYFFFAPDAPKLSGYSDLRCVSWRRRRTSAARRRAEFPNRQQKPWEERRRCHGDTSSASEQITGDCRTIFDLCHIPRSCYSEAVMISWNQDGRLFFRPGTGFPFLSAAKMRAWWETPERLIEKVIDLFLKMFCLIEVYFQHSQKYKIQSLQCVISFAIFTSGLVGYLLRKKIKHLGGRLEFVSESWRLKYMTQYAGSPCM